MKTSATALFLAVSLMISFQGKVLGESSEVTKVIAVADSAIARFWAVREWRTPEVAARRVQELELVSAKKYSSRSDDSVAQRNHAEELANRTYWMVYYIPKGHRGFGGAFTVFVDATSMEVIAVQGEK